MERSIFKSVRFKLMLYSLISLFLTVLSEIILCVLVYYTSTRMGQSKGSFGTMDDKMANINNKIGPMDNNHPMDMPKPDEDFFHKLEMLFNLNNKTLIIMSVAIIITLILFFVFYFMMISRRFSNGLYDISRGIHRLAKGDLSEKLVYTKDDELGDIVNNVNDMSNMMNSLITSERMALQSNKELITCIAHDLRTPITSVVGYIGLAVDEENYDYEQRKKFARIATDKADRLLKMIEDLFSFTKLTSGEMKLKKANIDIIKLVEQMIEEFYPMFEDNGMECEYETNIRSVMMDVDPSLIARAVSNLMSNAVKYGKDGKRIIIKCIADKDNYLNIKVTNFGLVIPEESLNRVFERFYRVEDSRSLATGGTGLGLNIAKEILEMHSGKIAVESGISGTTFTISLPMFEKEKEEVIEDKGKNKKSAKSAKIVKTDKKKADNKKVYTEIEDNNSDNITNDEL